MGLFCNSQITEQRLIVLRVTLTIPSLQILEDDGDIVGHSVQIKIQIQYDGGGFNDVVKTRLAARAATAINVII